jgi:uncharacterized LabA/DUF88 family protein
MGVNRTVIFVDEGNLTGICSKLNRSIDWLKLREQLSRDKELIEMFVYAGLPPNTPEWAEFRGKRERFLHWLESEAFYVVRKQGRPTTHQAYKANVDLMMAVEAVEVSLEIRPDTIVLVTGDGDFGHLACRLRRRGIRVEVAAFEHNLGEDLRISASAFVNLANIIKGSDAQRESLGVESEYLGNS